VQVDNPYDELGGAEPVRALVDRFYDQMDTLPEAAVIRAMHAADLSGARLKLFQFLSGWLGGPPLYVEAHGHPRLRARHLPFVIDTPAAAAWILCMEAALDHPEVPEGLRGPLLQSFVRLAAHMRNTEDRPGG
jgi:hemoglobin